MHGHTNNNNSTIDLVQLVYKAQPQQYYHSEESMQTSLSSPIDQTAATYLMPRPTTSSGHNQHAESLASLGPDLNTEFEIKVIGNRVDGHNSSSYSNTIRKNGEQGLDLVDHAGTSARGSLEPQSSSRPFGQLGYSAWFGYTLADWVFPNFIFMLDMTAVIVFSPIKPHAMKQSGSTFWQRHQKRTPLTFKIIKRSLTLFAIGIIIAALELINADLEWVQILGVLQRILFCYLVLAMSVP
ncbi:hypothetical protein BGZ51_005319 [Haplosporangium sp. Z 767]|nr:hypothetical protein BGZ51_005319 [Haplosporangium sp. Z 767]